MLEETVLTLAEAAQRLPAIKGKKVHPSSVWRWATQGVRGVHLESWRLGGRCLTTLEAVERFAAKLAERSRDTDASRR